MRFFFFDEVTIFIYLGSKKNKLLRSAIAYLILKEI